MRTKVDLTIDKALINACREVGFKHEVAPERLKDDDALLDEVVSLVRDVCDWPRSDIKMRIGNLRKKTRLYTLADVRAAKVAGHSLS